MLLRMSLEPNGLKLSAQFLKQKERKVEVEVGGWDGGGVVQISYFQGYGRWFQQPAFPT